MQGNHGKVWWCTPLSPAYGRLRQEDHKFRVGLGYIATYRLSLGYIVGVCLRTNREIKLWWSQSWHQSVIHKATTSIAQSESIEEISNKPKEFFSVLEALQFALIRVLLLGTGNMTTAARISKHLTGSSL